MDSKGIKALASAVLLRAYNDIAYRSVNYNEKTIKEIEKGGLDMWLGLLNLDMTGEEFLRRAMNSDKKLKFTN